MKKSTLALLSVVGVLALAAIWFVSTANGLVQKDEAVKAAWSQVENVYQRRIDLIPNLVATVKGYAKHEQETLEKVIQARNLAMQAPKNKVADFQSAQDSLGAALGRLLVVVEKYPDLKANENFRDLQSQIEGTENRISTERRRYNEVAQEYNTAIRMFPQSFVAGMKHLEARTYFTAAAGANVAPKVEF